MVDMVLNARISSRIRFHSSKRMKQLFAYACYGPVKFPGGGDGQDGNGKSGGNIGGIID